MSWTTQDELDFLRRIGTHAENIKLPREYLLSKYSESMFLRTHWAQIEPLAIQTELAKMAAL